MIVYRFKAYSLITGIIAVLIAFPLLSAADDSSSLDMGLSPDYFEAGKTPEGWELRKWPGKTKGAQAEWVAKDGVRAVRLHSKAALTFLEKTVDIDIRDYPIVTWKWRVENILHNIDETARKGDDHPIRIFFVFNPNKSKQSLWFRFKRWLYLDWVHGHPYGGRFTEFLWSSYLEPGSIINDPGKPMQKLVVIEGGPANLGKWLSYERNLYDDFKRLYGEEPRRLIFIGILNDTDQTGQEALSYIADLKFHRKD